MVSIYDNLFEEWKKETRLPFKSPKIRTFWVTEKEEVYYALKKRLSLIGNQRTITKI
jgi:hypothetical protein